jgi:F0F1-type ATP synthase membrane subunit b/b'
MDIDRDDVVKQLRADGHHDKAAKAEKELPKKVTKDEHKGLLDKLGIDDSIIDKIPGGLGDKKLKDIL